MPTLGAIGTVLGWIVAYAACLFFMAPVADWAWQWWKKMPNDLPPEEHVSPSRNDQP